MDAVYEDRQRRKRLIEKYREIAKRRYLDPEDECSISIPDHGDIEVMEDGAFVEATIWVPLPKDIS